MKNPPSPASGLWQGPLTGDTNGALTVLHLVNGEVGKFIIVLNVSFINTARVGLIVTVI